MPSGTLYVVATPIGNLADASPRALETLAAARTVALHEHNERAASAKLIAALRAGESVALVSDAGTPAISDPGAHLVAQAHAAGIRVVPIPGPNAAIVALCASGFAIDRFLFAGFLPASRGARQRALAALDSPWPVVFHEAPHRVLETVEDLAAQYGAARELLIARELTKKFEEVVRLPIGAARDWLLAAPHRQQGEFVLVLGPGSEPRAAARDEGERVLGVLLEKLPPSEAARLAARITGAPRNALYAAALRRAKER
jgi:16S rRNA (cytidine1402-2'-O)-methyltransferase